MSTMPDLAHLREWIGREEVADDLLGTSLAARFLAALDLPGSGPRRLKGKPAELSTGELQAALYNSACCYAKLGDTAAGVDALRAAVEAGFDDWDALRKGDADLAPLRLGAEWVPFVARLPAAKPPQSFLGGLFGR